MVSFAFLATSSSTVHLYFPLILFVGFSHSAFTFAHESLVVKSSTAQTEIPPGALITFLQKGLEYIAIEEHINEVTANYQILFQFKFVFGFILI